MSIIDPGISTPQEEFELGLWERAECYKFYVKERRRNCTFMELMNLWLRAPYCANCAVSEPFLQNSPADINGNWRRDVLWVLGEATMRRIKKNLRADREFALVCKRCSTELRPWNNDEVWVMKYHLEEHYDIPLEMPGRKRVPKKVCNQILTLYDKACFGCGTIDKQLHIDHICPRSKGGTSAFRNLQPLCEDCGNIKGSTLPDEVDVYSDLYFSPYPSDAYEGLFW